MPDEQKSEAKQEPKIIIYFVNGELKIEGNCFSQVPVALFMLETARDMIKANAISQAIQQDKNKIIPARGGIMNFMRGKK